MSSLLKTWGRLSLDGEPGASFVRLRIPEVAACATYAAKGIADDLEAILLEVKTESVPTMTDYPDARGLSTTAEQLAPGRSGRTRITLALSDARYRDVFQSLAQDVVSKLEGAKDEADAVRCFIARLERWQTFLRRHGSQELSLEHRRGLLGELILIRDHLLKRCDGNMAVSAWKGCHGANHDFQLRHGSIEVKTTSSNTPHAFHVSNIGQLDSANPHRLFIFLVLVEESEAGDLSLPEVIDSLRNELEGGAVSTLEDCLVEAGYLENQREAYASPRYSIRRVRFFSVDESFPRLREHALPTGVEEVQYQVAIAACAAFETSASVVLDTVVGATGAAQ